MTQLTFGPQIQHSDLAQIKASGCTTIICNRPDFEEAGQPSFQSIQAKAQELGLNAHHLPIQTREDADRHVKAFTEILNQSSGPVFAYCRSGARSKMLAQAAQRG